MQSLTPVTDDAGAAAEDAAPDRGQDSTIGSDLSAGVLEQIGEIAAGQAMVHGMLNELADYDMADSIDAVLRLHGHDPRQARLALRALADQTMAKLRDLAQLETQLLSQMAELQQTTADLRARPIETILRPLAALVETQSRRNGREARMTSAGSEMALDIALLDSLKRVLRPLVLACLIPAEGAPRRMHIVVNRNDEHLSVTLDHDGTAIPDPALLAPIEADATRAGGQIRQLGLPGGGRRFHIALPMNLVVLEGMVVGVGNTRYVLPVEAIRTILQPDPSTMLQVSAQGNQRWLRFGEDEVIAIRSLTEPGGKAEIAVESAVPRSAQGNVHVVLGRAGQSVAIPVDQLVGQQLVFLRPLRGLMSKMRNVAGVALLTGGDVGIVLSPGALCGASEGMGMAAQG
jgi:two-component system chemotaxis sensor kinase CheA